MNRRGAYWVDDIWYYEKDVINVGYTDKIDSDFFIDTQPARVLADMADRW